MTSSERPTCATCAGPVTSAGRGRPRKHCETCRPRARVKGPTELGVVRDLRPLPGPLARCAEAEAARALARAIDTGAAGLAANVRELRAVMVGLRTRAQVLAPPAPAPSKDTTPKGTTVVSMADSIAAKRAAVGGAPAAR